MAGLAEKARADKIVINYVALGTAKAPAAIDALARKTGGQSRGYDFGKLYEMVDRLKPH